jgi:outer membrane lipoprotein-sorting protein
MEFVRPHKGAVLVFNPLTKKARLRPFGFLKPFVLTLDPGNSLITSPQGRRVDASDLGTFLKTVKSLAEKGKTGVKGNEKVGGMDAVIVEVTGAKGMTVAGGVHRYLLWLDAQTLLPLKTRSFDSDDNMIEDVVMDDLDINVPIPDSLFTI